MPSLPSLANLGNTVYDLKEGYLETMKVLMSAMAQECFWQQAVLGQSFGFGLRTPRLGLRLIELGLRSRTVQERHHLAARDEGL